MSKTLKMPNRSDLCEIYERTERIAHFPPKVDILASRTAVGKDQRTDWPIMQMSYLVNDWKY